ncbi:MAG: hypothetical protein K2X43_04155 [Hyphomonadaceae bacterium]|jgi:hypothetical protein|nr:hypothetical protein [Hyphomonadaceae bacterium]
MPNSVAVLFVHGINVFEQNFSDDMQKALRRRLPESIEVAFAAVFWGDIVRNRQNVFLDDAIRAGIVDTSFRRFVVQGLGDAAAYQKTQQRKNSAYYEIQERVRREINNLDQPGHERRPLIIVAHSLGCHIVSSFAWDLNKVKQQPPAQLSGEDRLILQDATTPFRLLDTFAGFVTLGSNMPLFTFTFGPARVFPITSAPPGMLPAFPGRALDNATAGKARWLNFYSPNDLLGYPLKPLNNLYRDEPRLADKAVCAEGWFRSWFFPAPLHALAAHSGYWTNRTVIEQTVRLIEEVSGYEPKSSLGRLFHRRPNSRSMSASLSST